MPSLEHESPEDVGAVNETKHASTELSRAVRVLERAYDPGCYGLEGVGSDYTLIDDSFGSNSTANTQASVSQFFATLALSQNPEIIEFIENTKKLKPHSYGFNIQPFCERKALAGMKILDLGCGPAPTFARIARRLGADVYTVDILPATKLGIWKPSLDDIERLSYDKDKKEVAISLSRLDRESVYKMEDEKHVEIDLCRTDSVEVILARTGGRFDMVTEAHLFSGATSAGPDVKTPKNIKELTLCLLKEGGVMYSALSNTFWIKKDGTLICGEWM